VVSYVVSSYFVVCYWVLSGKIVGTSITSHAFFFFFSSGFCTYLESVNSYSWRIILKKSHRLSLLLSFLVSRKCFCKHKALFSFVLSQVSGRIHLSPSLITVEKFSQEYYLACGVCCFNNINF
jgi:hypothetical protein